MGQARLNKRNRFLGDLGLMPSAKLVMKPCVSKELAELVKSWQQKLLNISILNCSNWQKVGRGGQIIKGGFFYFQAIFETN